MNNKLLAAPIAAIAALTLGLAGCSSTDDSASSAAPTEITTPTGTTAPTETQSASPTSTAGAECTKEVIAASVGGQGIVVDTLTCSDGYAGFTYTEGGDDVNGVYELEDGKWVDVKEEVCGEDGGKEVPADIQKYCDAS